MGTSEDNAKEQSKFEDGRSSPHVAEEWESVLRVELSLVDDHTYFCDNQMFEVSETTPLTETENGPKEQNDVSAVERIVRLLREIQEISKLVDTLSSSGSV